MVENRYKEDYKPDAYITKRGHIVDDYIYKGDYYILKLDQKERKKAASINLILSFVMMFLFALAGFANNDGSRKFYIIIPYICMFMPAFYMIFGAIGFIGTPEKMQFAHYDSTLCRSRRSCIGVMVLAAIVFIIDLIFTIINRSTVDIGREVLFLCGLVLVFVFGLIYAKVYGHYFSDMTIEKSSNGDEKVL